MTFDVDEEHKLAIKQNLRSKVVREIAGSAQQCVFIIQSYKRLKH
jgi:hypothetical protein